MAFVTEIPDAAEARLRQADAWLDNEYSLWTIDRARDCFLVFLRQAEAVGGLPPREDYCFCYRGRVAIISTVLELVGEGSDVLYRWHLISSLGLAHQLQTAAQVVLLGEEGATRHAGHWDNAAVQQALDCLQEAFLNYKAHLGARDGSGARVAFVTAGFEPAPTD